MITNSKSGGRTIELFIPFEHGGKMITTINLSPFRFGDSLRWGEGDFTSSLALMTELAGVDEAVIRALRYPDVDRVMEAFIAMLPQDLRDDIANGRVPVKQRQPEPPPPTVKPNGAAAPDDVDMPSSHGVPMGPGDPLPEAGFDLSEEP